MLEKNLTLHRDHWKSCTKCEISRHCKQKILLTSRTDKVSILFFTAFPEKLDEISGQAFSGTTGKLILSAISHAEKQLKINLNYGLAHIIACRPSDGLGRFILPDEENIANCVPRVQELLELTSPFMVIGTDTFSKRVLLDITPKEIFFRQLPNIHAIAACEPGEREQKMKGVNAELKEFIKFMLEVR